MDNLQTVIDNNVTVIGAMLMTMSDVLDYADKDSVNHCINTVKVTLRTFIKNMQDPQPKEQEACGQAENKTVYCAVSKGSTTMPASRSVATQKQIVRPQPKLNRTKETTAKAKAVAGKKSIELKIKWKKLTQDDDMKAFVGKMLLRLGTYWQRCEMRNVGEVWQKLKGAPRKIDDLVDDSAYLDGSSSTVSPTKVRREVTRKSIGAPVVAHAFGSSFPVPPEAGSRRPVGVSSQPAPQAFMLKSRYELDQTHLSFGSSQPLLASDLYEPAPIVPREGTTETETEPSLLVRISSSETLNELLQREAPSPLHARSGLGGSGGSHDYDRDYLYSDSEHGSFSPTPRGSDGDRDRGSDSDSDSDSGGSSGRASTAASPELFDAETGEPIHSAESAVAMLFSSLQQPAGSTEAVNVKTVNDYWLGAKEVAPILTSDGLEEATEETAAMPAETVTTASLPAEVSAPVSAPASGADHLAEAPRTSFPGEKELEEELEAFRAQSLFSAVHLPSFSYLQTDVGGLHRMPRTPARTPQRENSAPDLRAVVPPGAFPNTVGEVGSTPSEAELLAELAAIRRQSVISAAHHLPPFSYADGGGRQPAGQTRRPPDPAMAVGLSGTSGVGTFHGSGADALDYFDCDSLADGFELPP
jgi:hypothetical protein